jgi:predicted metalloendopeptidase
MKNIKTFEGFLNESTAIKELETTVNETLSFVNEAAPVLTPEVAAETKEAIKKAIEGIKDAPAIDDKTKVSLVKTGIGLAVIDAIAQKFGDRPATPEARSKMKDFMSKVNFAKSLEDVEKVIFDVVDYALEVAQETK